MHVKSQLSAALNQNVFQDQYVIMDKSKHMTHVIMVLNVYQDAALEESAIISKNVCSNAKRMMIAKLNVAHLDIVHPVIFAKEGNKIMIIAIEKKNARIASAQTINVHQRNLFLMIKQS